MTQALRELMMMWYNSRLTYPNIIAEEVSHDALNDIETDVCPKLNSWLGFIIPGMSHVGVIVDCGTAHVPGDLVLILVSRDKYFLIMINILGNLTFSLENELMTLSLGASPMGPTNKYYQQADRILLCEVCVLSTILVK